MGLTRSEQMARIRGRNTRPEQLLRSALWRAGLRYRLRHRLPVGRPDLVFPGAHVAVFVDGCFWHGCPEHYVRPRSRQDFWAKKLRENVERDIRQTTELEEIGWRVVRIWEHEVFMKIDLIVQSVREALTCRAKPRPAGLQYRVIAARSVDQKKLERWTMIDLRSPRAITVDRMRSTAKW
jgi:DNA mismatch endonuclease (patch repair protein)